MITINIDGDVRDISHVTRVAHAAVAGLRGALVEAHLQVHLALAGAQLVLGERSLVLFGHLRAQRRSSELRMLLGLRTTIVSRVSFDRPNERH